VAATGEVWSLNKKSAEVAAAVGVLSKALAKSAVVLSCSKPFCVAEANPDDDDDDDATKGSLDCPHATESNDEEFGDKLVEESNSANPV